MLEAIFDPVAPDFLLVDVLLHLLDEQKIGVTSPHFLPEKIYYSAYICEACS